MRFAVKGRPRGALKFKFVGERGSLSHLRIYAITFQEKALAACWIATNAPSNPTHEFKIVPFDKRPKS